MRGEIDIGNAERLAAVLDASIVAGAHTVDLTGVEFFFAAGISAFERIAEFLCSRGDWLPADQRVPDGDARAESDPVRRA